MSDSSTPRGRGESSNTRKTSKFKPRSSIRRSQIERDAQEKAESDRQKARQLEATRTTDRGRGRGINVSRGRGDFRGGLSGWRNESQSATGFLGSGMSSTSASNASHLPSTRAERVAQNDNDVVERSDDRRSTETRNKGHETSSTRGTRTGANSSSITRVSRESAGSKVKKEEDGDLVMTDGGYEDEKTDINIDELAYVNLISDDDEDDNGKQQKSFNPVRMARKQHIDRKAPIQTTTSSEISRRVRREANAKGVSISDIQVIANDEGVTLKTTKGKGKEQAKSSRQRANDPESVDDSRIKAEDDGGLSILAADPATHTADSSTRIDIDIVDDEDPTSLLPKRLKSRRQQPPLFSKPLLQTPEDYEEWDRHETDMIAIAEEFGNDLPQADNSSIRGASDGSQFSSRRNDKVYLFQFPPIMPNLCTPSEAEIALQQPTDLTENERLADSHQEKGKKPARDIGNTQETAVKIEEDNKDSVAPIVNSLPLALNAGVSPNFTGQVGTLKVYESGATALDWGGITFELDRGIGSMLQEALLVDDHAGVANSMSQVVASFIVKPSWDTLFEAEEKSQQK